MNGKFSPYNTENENKKKKNRDRRNIIVSILGEYFKNLKKVFIRLHSRIDRTPEQEKKYREIIAKYFPRDLCFYNNVDILKDLTKNNEALIQKAMIDESKPDPRTLEERYTSLERYGIIKEKYIDGPFLCFLTVTKTKGLVNYIENVIKCPKDTVSGFGSYSILMMYQRWRKLPKDEKQKYIDTFHQNYKLKNSVENNRIYMENRYIKSLNEFGYGDNCRIITPYPRTTKTTYTSFDTWLLCQLRLNGIEGNNVYDESVKYIMKWLDYTNERRQYWEEIQNKKGLYRIRTKVVDVKIKLRAIRLLERIINRKP